MTITQNISLDVSRENAFRVVHAKQYDQNSRYLKIRVLEHGEELRVTEGDVFLNVKRADGERKAFTDGCQVNPGDGTVTVKIPNWSLLVHGQHTCDVSILNSNCKLSTLNFTLRVERSPYNGSETSKDGDYDIFTEFNSVKEQVDDILSGERVVPKANQATNDGNGDEISTTYFKQEKLFIGTIEEYEVAYAEERIAVGALVIIIDDEEDNTGGGTDDEGTDLTSAVLGVAILGQMILG